MERVLLNENGLDFGISDKFDSRYLVPIIKNLLSKAETNWDDYNEVYHCCKLIETVKADHRMSMDFHFLKNSEQYLGIALVTHGELNLELFFKKSFQIAEKVNDILIFNYFHISSDGRGNGEKWLRDVIIEYYKLFHYKAVYIKSSHPKVFSMYSRLGVEIGEYLSQSDNERYERSGKIFRIPL